MPILAADHYLRIAERLRAGDPAVATAARDLGQAAAGYQSAPAEAVTDKTFTEHSPSRDPHDYVSVATYFWPNPETPDGLPYVPRDGELSPDIGLYDRPRWARTARAVVTLARHGHVTGERRWLDAAAERLRRWFCDSATRMHPHLRHAQMVPGRSTGRCYGIIDLGLGLPTVLDHLALIADGGAWTATDDEVLRAWCADFAAWLDDDPLAREERDQVNNHGVFYDRLAAHLAGFLGREDAQRVHLRRASTRIASQIAPDGSMPLELRRTCSFGYSLMNLRGLLELAWMGRQAGVDLWGNSAPGSGTITDAVGFLHAAAVSHLPWPHPQIEPIDWRMVVPVLQLTDRFSPGTWSIEALAHRLPPGFDAEAFALVEPDHPFGDARAA